MKAHRCPDLVGCVGTITSGLVEYIPGKPVQDVDIEGKVSPSGRGWCGPPDSMEPIDDNTGDWRVIEHVTRWNPYKVNA